MPRGGFGSAWALISGLCVLSSATGATAAPPSLFYSLLPLDHDQETCLKRAHAVVSSEVAGKLDRRPDNVALVNDEVNLGVHCRRTGSKSSFVTIVVAHSRSFKEAKGLALNIRRGMETGLIE